MAAVRKVSPVFTKPVNPWYCTVLIFVIAFIFQRITQTLIGHEVPPHGVITDRLQILATPINHYFHIHPEGANGVLIATSLWVDISVIFLGLRALFGASIRPFLALFMFIVYRQALEFLVSLPIPQDIIWHYPGFFSLFVDYSSQNDLYFSAHTGVTLLCALELGMIGKKWLTFIGYFFFALVLVTLISFRIHYTMDIFTAILVTLYIVYRDSRMAPHIDRFLQSIGTKVKRRKV